MNEYERMSREQNENAKNYMMAKPYETQNNNNPQHEPKQKDFTFTGFMGIILIILGVVGAIGIVFSFDWSLYSEVKEFSYSDEIELSLMKSELTTTMILAGVTLIGNLAIGSVLIALDTIIKLLRGEKK